MKGEKRRKSVDVNEDGKWMTFPSMGQAATYLGVSITTVKNYIGSGKRIKNCLVRMHDDEGIDEALEESLREIEERNRKPYEFTNGRDTPSAEEPRRMTHTELVTRLCEHVADIEELRTQFRSEWLIDTRLKDIASRLQLLMKEIQEGGGQ